MNRVFWHNAIIPTTDDLRFMQDSLISNIKLRTSTCFNKGILPSSTVVLERDTDKTLKVNPFSMFTPAGEYIMSLDLIRGIALNLAVPNDRRLGTQGDLEDTNFGWEENVPYLILAKYEEVAAHPRVAKGTASAYFTRVYGSICIYAYREGIDIPEQGGYNPFVQLGRVIYTNNLLTVYTTDVEYTSVKPELVKTTGKESLTTDYSIDAPVSFSGHIKSIGTGTVTKSNPHGMSASDLGIDTQSTTNHEKLLHSSGILGNKDSVVSSLYHTVNVRSSDIDNIVIMGLSSTEELVQQGTHLKKWIYNSDRIYITLADGSGNLPEGTYTTYLDIATGNIVISTNVALSTPRTAQIALSAFGSVVSSISIINDSQVASSLFKLCAVIFSHTKTYTTIDLGNNGLNESNFTGLVDFRLFGTISANNLQVDKRTDAFTFNYPIIVPSIKFASGGTLSGAVSYPLGYIANTVVPQWVNGTTIRIPAGIVKDALGRTEITLATDMVKTITARWSAGSGQGGLPPTVNTPTFGTYHIFIIGNNSGSGEVAFDTDVNAANIINTNLSGASPIPNYHYYRRIGSIFYQGLSTGILKFYAIPMGNGGLEVVYTTPQYLDTTYSTVNEINLKVPAGINTKVHLRVDATVSGYKLGSTVFGATVRQDAIAGDMYVWTDTGLAKQEGTVTANTIKVLSYTDGRTN